MGRSLRPIVSVALGGAIGSLVRWGLIALAPSDRSTLALFAINVVGSLLLGLVLGGRERLTEQWRLGLGTGFAGGLTTFSGYAVVVATNLDDGALLSASANGLATPVVAMLAAGLGFRVTRTLGARGISIGHTAGRGGRGRSTR